MIVRLNFKDNDFSDLIKQFTHFNLCDALKLFLPTSDKAYMMIAHKANELLNPNVNDSGYLSNEDKEWLKERIKISFMQFYRVRKNNEDEDKIKSLLKDVEITFINEFSDEDENGEVWYWFQHSGLWINQ